MSLILAALQAKRASRTPMEREAPVNDFSDLSLKPKTLLDPDRETFYCDVQTPKFRILGVKILQHYENGDCRVLAPNGIQFTAKAEEVFHIRKGDWHEAVEL